VLPQAAGWAYAAPVRRTLPLLGHALIDRQHLRLAELAGALHERVMRNRPASAAMRELQRATRRHFATEERLMRTTGYPETAGHTALHDGVIAEMAALSATVAKGLPLHRKQSRAIEEWLDHHVSAADENLVRHLLAQRRQGQSSRRTTR
jgi:hemerythrin